MSRPIRFLLPAFFLASTLAFTGCVGTIYDRMYSNKKSYFKPPEDKKEVSAESILGSLEKKPDAGAGDAAAPGGLPPAGADVPGLPPAGLPAPDAGAVPAPAVPPPATPPPN